MMFLKDFDGGLEIRIIGRRVRGAAGAGELAARCEPLAKVDDRRAGHARLERPRSDLRPLPLLLLRAQFTKRPLKRDIFGVLWLHVCDPLFEASICCLLQRAREIRNLPLRLPGWSDGRRRNATYRDVVGKGEQRAVGPPTRRLPTDALDRRRQFPASAAD